ncbi:protein of unknown function [Caballeronia sp. S22]
MQSSRDGLLARPPDESALLRAISPALLHFVAFTPPLYAALGMIAQRKPNQDKGFKDLPLYFLGSRRFFQRRTTGSDPCYAS